VEVWRDRRCRNLTLGLVRRRQAAEATGIYEPGRGITPGACQ
jgi:hypothetical protein